MQDTDHKVAGGSRMWEVTLESSCPPGWRIKCGSHSVSLRCLSICGHPWKQRGCSGGSLEVDGALGRPSHQRGCLRGWGGCLHEWGWRNTPFSFTAGSTLSDGLGAGSCHCLKSHHIKHRKKNDFSSFHFCLISLHAFCWQKLTRGTGLTKGIEYFQSSVPQQSQQSMKGQDGIDIRQTNDHEFFF